MLGLEDSFLPVRGALRSVMICSLLIFAHVLLIIMALTPREIMEAYPELPHAVKVLSATTFLTLLWKVFLLFELADPAETRPPTKATPATVKFATSESNSEGDRDDESAGGHIYTMTLSEVVIGTVALLGWALSLPSALTVFYIFSARIAKELALLPISYSMATGCLVLSHLQLLIQLYRLRKTRAMGARFWTARTGQWETRVALEEESGEKV